MNSSASDPFVKRLSTAMAIVKLIASTYRRYDDRKICLHDRLPTLRLDALDYLNALPCDIITA
jgi:hypothetical protein